MDSQVLCRNIHQSACILALICLVAAGGVEGVLVLDCGANSRPGSRIGARITDVNITSGQDLTGCIRFQFARLQRVNIAFVVIGTSTKPIMQLEVNVDNLRVCVRQQYWFHVLDRWLRPRRWYFVCITHSYDTGQVTTYFMGQVLSSHELTQSLLMQQATEVAVGHHSSLIKSTGMAFIGKITHFNLWGRVLSLEEVRELTWCEGEGEGDLVSWNGPWNIVEALEYHVDLPDLCLHLQPPGIQVFPRSRYSEGVGVCEAMGGIVPLPHNLTHANEMITYAREVRPECALLWIGVTDNVKEGSWIHHLSGKPVHLLPWSVDEPNGIHYENCGGLEEGGVVDDDCEALRCTTCQLAHDLVLTLRGSCETLAHNVNYMMSRQAGRRIFLGYGEYSILYNGTNWVWMDHGAQRLVATLWPGTYHPVGRRWWQLHRSVCKQTTGSVRRLLLSACSSHQFTCDDGTCVSLSLRCDLKYDCRDESDESDCVLVRVPQDYKTSVAPRVLGWRAWGGGGNEMVTQDLTALITITNLRVDTAHMLLKVALNLTLAWIDPRLTYVNLKDDHSLNVLDNNVSEVWRPSVILLNTMDTPPLAPPHASIIHVLRQGTPHGTDNSLPEEVLLYNGGDNPLVEQRQYQASFTCDFGLYRYPFDTQTCFIALQLAAGSSETLRWGVKDSCVKYAGSTLLMEYTVGPVTLTKEEAILKIRLPLARRDGYAVINIYVPSLTMLIIGYLTLYFVRENFEVRVMTSLTSLLVMATLFTQVASSLPKTSYFKLVDIWLLFCIFSTFFIIIFHILIDLLLNDIQHIQNNVFNPHLNPKTIPRKINSTINYRTIVNSSPNPRKINPSINPHHTTVYPSINLHTINSHMIKPYINPNTVNTSINPLTVNTTINPHHITVNSDINPSLFSLPANILSPPCLAPGTLTDIDVTGKPTLNKANQNNNNKNKNKPNLSNNNINNEGSESTLKLTRKSTTDSPRMGRRWAGALTLPNNSNSNNRSSVTTFDHGNLYTNDGGETDGKDGLDGIEENTTSVFWLWFLSKVSVVGMEKFARLFMLVVFFIFNIIYWLIAYLG